MTTLGKCRLLGTMVPWYLCPLTQYMTLGAFPCRTSLNTGDWARILRTFWAPVTPKKSVPNPCIKWSHRLQNDTFCSFSIPISSLPSTWIVFPSPVHIIDASNHPRKTSHLGLHQKPLQVHLSRFFGSTQQCREIRLRSKTSLGTQEWLISPSTLSYPLSLQILHMQASTRQLVVACFYQCLWNG